jgi:hypothetical protein
MWLVSGLTTDIQPGLSDGRALCAGGFISLYYCRKASLQMDGHSMRVGEGRHAVGGRATRHQQPSRAAAVAPGYQINGRIHEPNLGTPGT